MNAADGGERPTVARRHTWTALGLLCLVNLFNYMDRMLLAAMAHPIQQEFRLTDTELGLLTGVAFALFYAFLGVPLGRVADFVPRKKLLAACITLWSVATAATGMAQNYVHLLLARMSIAVGEAGCSPSSYSLLADYFPPHKRNTASGLFNAGSMVGVILGFALGGWISQTYGWRAAFFALGLPGVILAVSVLLFLREPTRGAMDRAGTATSVPFAEAVRLLATNRPYVLLVIACGINAMGVFGVSQWMPLFFIRSHGMSLAAVGAMFGIAYGVGMFLGQLSGGVIGDRLARRSLSRPLILSVVASVIVVPLYWGALLLETTAFALVLTFIAALIGASANPPASAGIQTMVPASVRATAAAVVSLSVALIGIGLGPIFVGVGSDLLAGWLKEDALRCMLILLQLVNLLAALFYGLSARAMRLQMEERI